MRISLLTLTLVLASACNYNVLVVEVESREVCVSDISAEFPGGASGTATATLKTEEGGEMPQQDVLGLDLPEGFELTEVTLLGIGLEAREGIADFGFVHTLNASLASRDPNVPLPDVELIRFDTEDRNYSAETSTGGTKYLPSRTSVNLLDYLEADELELALDVDGDMPDDKWAIGLDVCFTFVAEYHKGL